MKRNGWLGAYVPLMVVAVIATLNACATFNPVSQAETTEQKAWALYGTFVVFQEQAAGLTKDPNTPAEWKSHLSRADREAYPVAEGLFRAGQEVIVARRLFAEDASQAEKLDIALRNLSAWYIRAQPAVGELVTTVRGGK